MAASMRDCRVLTAKTGEIEWEYPRGGYGVLFQVRLTTRRCQRSAEPAVRLSEADIDRVLEEDIRFGDLTVRALAIGEKPGRMVFTAVVILCFADRMRRAVCSPVLEPRSSLPPKQAPVSKRSTLVGAEGTAAALHAGWKTAQTLMEWASGVRR